MILGISVWNAGVPNSIPVPKTYPYELHLILAKRPRSNKNKMLEAMVKEEIGYI